MRLRIIALLLTPVLGFLCPNVFFASGTNPPPPRQAAAQVPQFSEAELTERFNKILDKELSVTNVCVAPPAARRLADLTKAAAAKIVRTKEFGRVGEVDNNIRALAKHLLEPGPDKSTLIRITPDDIDSAINQGAVDPSEGRGLCPLFPFC